MHTENSELGVSNARKLEREIECVENELQGQQPLGQDRVI